MADKYISAEALILSLRLEHRPTPHKETVYCKDCENLMFSDCYGECAKAHKGIARPDDTCEHGIRRNPKGE